MSFILDALKKSELERQRQSSPGLIEPGFVRPRPRFPLWALALLLLLLVNLVVLGVIASRNLGSSGDTAPKPAALASTAPGPASQAAMAPAPALPGTSATVPAVAVTTGPGASAASGSGHAAPAFSPMDGSEQYAPEIPVEPQPAEATAESEPHSAMRASRHAAESPAEPPEEVLPSISELHMTGPELHLDVHVWATRPSDRFVYINMHRYREGQTLEEGPTVERIRRDGVVLAYQGVRFLLPRQ